MAKSASKKRRLNDSKAAPVTAVIPETSDEAELVGGLIFPDELQITIDTLTTLSNNPEVLKSKAFKGLKTAVWDFQTKTGRASTGISLISNISLALTDGRYTDALVLLAELRIRKQKLKLGTLQRWVRECDAASKTEGEVVWEVLEAILRTTEDYDAPSASTAEIVKRTNDWIVKNSTGGDLWGELQAGTLIDSEAVTLSKAFCPLLVTPGAERRPPNVYSSTIYYSPSDPFQLALSPPPPTARLDHPSVPGLFLLTDVLTHSEARKMVQATEAVGFEPDQPAGGSAVDMISVLAHNLIWLANPEFHDTLYNRIKHLLPPVLQGGPVRGINKRFRIYRYRPGAVYRPHIDGAWPASALSETSPPEYVYDSDPLLYSRLTLLIYLNDGFPGGCTTFFVPGNSGLDAMPVRPIMGSAAVFPHGDTKGSLLHEGSAVLDSAKYVIRTEVLYEVGKAGRGD